MAVTAARPLPHIPVGEYLGSVYRPDVDYVDGELDPVSVRVEAIFSVLDEE